LYIGVKNCPPCHSILYRIGLTQERFQPRVEGLGGHPAHLEAKTSQAVAVEVVVLKKNSVNIEKSNIFSQPILEGLQQMYE
jgi:hypothetical protein